MKRLTLIGLLALAVAILLALPGSALAKGGHGGSHANRGNHCGHGHAKHTKKVGRACQKLTRNGSGSANSQGNAADDPQAGDDDQDQAGDDQDEAGDDQDQAGDDDQDEAGDDQDEAGDDDQGDVDDDQGDDDDGGSDDG